VAAHNGAFTTVYPVEGIAVDGNFSDWPAESVRHAVAVQVAGDGAPEDSLDFQGFFRLGYNSRENALYVAIEVADESIVATGDGCEIYLAVGHDTASPPKQFALWGTFRPKINHTLSWAQVAVKRGVRFHRYEWRLNIDLVSQEQVQLAAGMRLGLDVVIIDKDRDGSDVQMSWGPESQKSEDVLWLGDILLAKVGESMASVSESAIADIPIAAPGLLSGTIYWEGADKPVRYGRLVAETAGTAGLVASLVADGQGSFGRELPAGQYRVRSIEPVGSEEISMQVEPGQTHEIVLTVPPPAGKTQATGEQFQQGLWLSLDRADGLENPEVRSIAQDRKGHMWFCTHFGGIYRYDGKYFTRFGAQDGLGAKGTHAVLVDRNGHLWVGHHRGLTRFDGGSFQLFTSEDGLATGEIHVLYEDRAGHLWIGADGGLSRFDGREFTTFDKDDGLTHNEVISLAEDRDGYLWVGTSHGLNQFTGQYFMRYKGTGRLRLSHMKITALAVGNDGAVWAGTPMGLARFDGERFIPQKSLVEFVNALHVDAAGDLWIGGDKGLIWYDGQAFRRFTAEDGLLDNTVIAIFANRDGHLWLGTPRGVSRFDRDPFIHFTRDNGLPHEAVWDVVEDVQGRIWFASHGGGLVRYDGGKITAFTAADGLPDDYPHALYASRAGPLWIGSHHGLSRYDGEGFTTFTEADGLSADMINALAEDREGRLWIGTNLGLSHYDGKEFTSLTVKDGLPDNRVLCLWVDQGGLVWIGTNLGLSHYDGKEFTSFPQTDSLSARKVTSLFQDATGRLWVGSDRGLELFDGQVFTPTAMADTMGFETVDTIVEDEVGHLWFDLPQEGVERYDGQIVQRLGRRDRLPHGDVFKIYPDSKGYVWIATQNGVSRYRSRRVQPRLRLTNVVVDREDLGPVETLRRPAPQDYIAFHFQGSGYYSDTRHIAYLYRLRGQHEDWRDTRNSFVEYRDLSRADYLFEVRAVDRDLNYSQMATVEVIIHAPYTRWAFFGVSGLAVIGFILASGTAFRRHRAFLKEQRVRMQAQEALNRGLEEELQTAHELQMGLMPTDSPQIESFNIAGRCIPANHVGGDFFQYFEQDVKLSVCMADVTGHAMEAAVPVMMFSGILDNQMEAGEPLEELFTRLNRSLYRNLDRRTFVCFTMAELEPQQRTLRLLNCGCPYPYHFRATSAAVEELQMDAYPLGVRPDAAYSALERVLEPGDCVVFCSDGIIEAGNEAEEIFGFERTAETIRRGCADHLAAGALVDHIIAEVQSFAGSAVQGDDMTVVVLQVL